MNTDSCNHANSKLTQYERTILSVVLMFLVMTVLDAPMRLILAQIGLSALAYLPKSMMVALIFVHMLIEPAKVGYSEKRLIAIVVAFYALLVGVLFLPIKQVFLGFFILVPFIFGIVCADVIRSHITRYRNIFFGLWLIAVIGVLANQAFEYPWEGFTYQVGDVEVSGSRQWYASGGKKRLAGFSRASFDAAGQIVVLAVLFVVQIRQGSLRALIWLLTMFAVLPTNSKGMLLVAIILFPIIILRTRQPEIVLRALPFVFGGLALTLPISTLFLEFHSQFNNPQVASMTFSFFDRLNRMWPEAWGLLRDHGSLIMGRGLGGLGTAQSYSEVSLFNAGDNIFMYFIVIFGLFAIPGFCYFLLKTLRIRPLKKTREFIFYCLLLIILIYGSLTNIVENALLALVCGVIVRWVCASQLHESVVEPSGNTSSSNGVANVR